MMKKTVTLQISKVLAALVSMAILAGSLQVMVWSSRPSIVLTINNDPVPAKPPEVKGGDKVYLDIDFCQSVSAVMVTEVKLRGEHGAIIDVNWPSGRVEKGCNVYKDVPVPIPGQTPTDTYVVEFKSCANVNPIKNNQCTTFKSKPFKVMNPKLNPGDAQVQ